MPPVLIRAEAYKTCVQLAVVCYTLPASGAIVDFAHCLTVANCHSLGVILTVLSTYWGV